MSKKVTIKWLAKPAATNFPSALSYLTLLYDKRTAGALVRKLKRARTTPFKSKDIFRASGLSLLGVSNTHVERDEKKIKAGAKLSPLLLVRDPQCRRVLVADGYHRLCAVYSHDEDAVIPCRIV